MRIDISTLGVIASIIGTIYTVASYYKSDNNDIIPKKSELNNTSIINNNGKHVNDKINSSGLIRPSKTIDFTEKSANTPSDKVREDSEVIKPLGGVIRSNHSKYNMNDFATKNWVEEYAIKPIPKDDNEN